MRENRKSGLMSGEGKRSDADTAQATAPFLDSTEEPYFPAYLNIRLFAAGAFLARGSPCVWAISAAIFVSARNQWSKSLS